MHSRRRAARPAEASSNNTYDLVVVGSGPAGQKAAICAAKLRKKVAVIERKRTIGGVCVHTGTIPSKTFREAILYLSGLRQRAFYGRGYALKENISMQDLVFRADAVMAREIEVIKAQLRRNRVTVYEGNARFLDAHTMEVASDDGLTVLRGDNFVIACGTRPAHDAHIPIDGKRIFDSDQVHELQELPRELIVVGAGIIGLEYASMFAALGVKVTLLDQRPTLLDFVDREIVESLCFSFASWARCFVWAKRWCRSASTKTATASSPSWRAARRSTERRCSTQSGGRPTATNSTWRPSGWSPTDAAS